MMTTTDHAFMPNEDRIVKLLQKYGARSFDDLTQLAGLDWVTAFSIIDRLSRAGLVMLRKQGTEYRVSVEKGT
jgi:DNA-binding IclR family transcriptional regulator